MCFAELEFHPLPEVQPVTQSAPPSCHHPLHAQRGDGAMGYRAGTAVTQKVSARPEVLLRAVTFGKCFSKARAPLCDSAFASYKDCRGAGLAVGMSPVLLARGASVRQACRAKSCLVPTQGLTCPPQHLYKRDPFLIF